MKVLLVNGSPHRDGCTYTALSEVAAELERNGIDTEIFWLGNRPISGCISCGACAHLDRCAIDDCCNAFIAKAIDADGFVFGSPVHFAAASGAITSFMDRAFYSSRKTTAFANKPAACLVSARRAGTTAALDQLHKYMHLYNMPIATSQYWNMVHGSTPDDVRHDEEGLQIMRTLGKNLAWLMRCIDTARRAGITPPTYETPLKTNFIR